MGKEGHLHCCVRSNDASESLSVLRLILRSRVSNAASLVALTHVAIEHQKYEFSKLDRVINAKNTLILKT